MVYIEALLKFCKVVRIMIIVFHSLTSNFVHFFNELSFFQSSSNTIPKTYILFSIIDLYLDDCFNSFFKPFINAMLDSSNLRSQSIQNKPAAGRPKICSNTYYQRGVYFKRRKMGCFFRELWKMIRFC